ncbi:hypothetical protein [Streptomyces sp. WZ.A104]|uniref:hypothetical protein n=1 Tax=Streptomyces sp. WZ.A104 TaxID=2023771 RepID=UPI0026ADE592|nr:hypothetical protein [Streptomyces sp. WZ.A104]
MTHTAVRITAASHHVTVASSTPSITDWSRRYFGPWWQATSSEAGADAGPLVAAGVDETEAAQLAQLVTDYPHDVVTYANAPLLHTRDDDGCVYAHQPDSSLSYQYQPDVLRIAGTEPVPVALAAARLARELLRSQLLADGWHILHASAAVRDGSTVLTLGEKGAGKTTTALLLAQSGWQLLANDRVFVRPDGDGGVDVLPWPSAAAIGLGSLDALGVYDEVRARHLAGERLHPTQHERVSQALTDGKRDPIFASSGKELKPQFFPDQLTTWLGLPLAVSGKAGRIVFPRIAPAAAPAVEGRGRELVDSDFFTAGTEDRYPDVFGLAPKAADDEVRRVLADRLTALPSVSVALNHDRDASAKLLRQLTS